MARKSNPIKVIAIVLASLLAFVGLVILVARIVFMAPVQAYYDASVKTFEIPGTDEGLVAQGLSVDDKTGNFFVTGYMNDGSASPIYIVNKNSYKLEKKILMQNEDGTPYTGHAGGLSVRGDYVYVAGGGYHCLFVYSYEEIINAANGAFVKCIGTFSTQVSGDDYLGIAFTAIDDTYMYVGEFYREENYPTLQSHKMTTKAGDYNQAICLAYRWDNDGQFGLNTTPEFAYSMPDLVQGMFVTDGEVYLSTSYAVASSHIYVYDKAQLQAQDDLAILGVTVPCYALDSASLTKDYTIAPMSEEIVIVNGKLYVMCESASNKYIFGKFTDARWCYATDLSKLS